MGRVRFPTLTRRRLRQLTDWSLATLRLLTILTEVNPTLPTCRFLDNLPMADQPSRIVRTDFLLLACCSKTPLGELGAQAFLRLDLLQKGIDFLFLFQRVEPSINVVA